MNRIDKQFPGVRALKEVSLDLFPAEVHALVGENGAGKSTLIKILSGYYYPDGGEIYIQGKKVVFEAVAESRDYGIGVIFQEFNLVPHLSVLENIIMGSEPSSTLIGLINWNKAKEQVAEIIERINIDLDLKEKVCNLGVGRQQMVEICKSLILNPSILVMDEPTASLTNEEIKELFRLIGELKRQGVSIIYISHRLEEIFRIADRVTVLRDGKTIDTKPIEATDNADIVKMMTGRSFSAYFPDIDYETIKPEKLLELKDVTSTSVEDVSLYVRRGEILGFYGVMGAGRTELAKTIFGIDKIISGTVKVEGKEVNITSPRNAIENGIGFLTEDRKEEGLFLQLNPIKNITIASINEFLKHGIINKKEENRVSSSYIEKLSIKIPDKNNPSIKLSGGNQQKVLFAKWLNTRPKVFILDEPTRGIDVGAKTEIFRLLVELTQNGYGIIFISSELPEVISLSHRITVMRGRRVIKTLEHRDEINQENVLKYAL